MKIFVVGRTDFISFTIVLPIGGSLLSVRNENENELDLFDKVNC